MCASENVCVSNMCVCLTHMCVSNVCVSNVCVSNMGVRRTCGCVRMRVSLYVCMCVTVWVMSHI